MDGVHICAIFESVRMKDRIGVVYGECGVVVNMKRRKSRSRMRETESISPVDISQQRDIRVWTYERSVRRELYRFIERRMAEGNRKSKERKRNR